MHPVANEVDVPTEQIERELLRRAVPGFKGSVAIYMRVRPEAGTHVWFTAEENARFQKNQESRPVDAKPFDERMIPTERALEVRAILARHKHRFRIGMRITKIIGHFDDGHLNAIDFQTVTEQP